MLLWGGPPIHCLSGRACTGLGWCGVHAGVGPLGLFGRQRGVVMCTTLNFLSNLQRKVCMR